MYISEVAHSPIRKPVRVLLAVAAGFLSLPALIFGSYFLICWIRRLPVSARCSGARWGGKLKRVLQLVWCFSSEFLRTRLCCPIPVRFGDFGLHPDGTPHMQRSMSDDTNCLSSVSSFFQVWYESHHRFPKDEGEFVDALRGGPAAWQYGVNAPSPESDYAKDGVRLPYEIVVTNDATGPRLQGLSQRPGVIYYCVTADEQQFWVTMTGLHKDVSRTATLKRIADGLEDKPWLFTATGRDNPPPGR